MTGGMTTTRTHTTGHIQKNSMYHPFGGGGPPRTDISAYVQMGYVKSISIIRAKQTFIILGKSKEKLLHSLEMVDIVCRVID